MRTDMVAEYSQKSLVAQTLAWQVIGILLMICHVLLCKLSIAFFPLVMVLVAYLFMRSSLAGTLVFLQILLFQNMIISIFSADMALTTFSALMGTNFVILVLLASISVLRLIPLGQHRAIIRCVFIALAVTALYTAIGAVKSGPTSALIYFREFTGPVFAGCIGIEVGRVWGYKTVGLLLLYGSMLSIGLSLFEYCYPIEFYSMINNVQFVKMKFHDQIQISNFYTPQDIVNSYKSVFFNITGASDREYAMNSYRVGGTILNPISNAYIISVLAILAFSLKRGYWLILLGPMLLMVGVKGATILLGTSLILYLVWVGFYNRRVLFVAGFTLIVCYIGFGIYTGLQNADAHVLGFMGGFNSLIHNPAGHGIGVGGNLSAKAAQGLKWTGSGGWFRTGADFALESAIGVMIYQMGVAAITILSVFVIFVWHAPLGMAQRFALPRRSDIIFFATIMILVNGIFQEEAFAPYAAGLIMLLAGVLLGNQRRSGQIIYDTPHLDRRMAVA